jgi:hypothetical protein
MFFGRSPKNFKRAALGYNDWNKNSLAAKGLKQQKKP